MIGLEGLYRPGSCGPEGMTMTARELAEEFTDLWNELEVGDINEMLAKNVGMDLLEFFVGYADRIADELDSKETTMEELRMRLPNLLVIGYPIRLLEERVK